MFSDTIIVTKHLSIVLDVLASWSPIILLLPTSHIRPQTSLIEGISFFETKNVEFYFHFASVFD